MSEKQALPAVVDGSTPFRQTGTVTEELARRVLAKARSPLLDETTDILRAGAEMSALAFSQAAKESSYGLNGVGAARKNALGLMAADGKTLMAFNRWADGFFEWHRRMTDPAYKGGVYMPLSMTMRNYIAIYVGGPGCAATGVCANGETQQSVDLYLKQTVARLNRLHGWADPDPVFGTGVSEWGETLLPLPSPSKPADFNPFDKPPIYDLVRDAARFGLTTSQAQALRNNCFRGRPQGIKAIFLHIQEGTTRGSLNWWATGPGVQASSSVMAQKDGSLLRVITDDNAPWTNGDVSSPTSRGRALVARFPGLNLNQVTVSVEAEGYWQDTMPYPQAQAICWMAWEWMRRHKLGIADIYRHADVNQTSRANCPGRYYDTVVAALQAAVDRYGEP